MKILLEFASRLHGFLAGHLFYSLALFSALSVALFVGRTELSGNYTYAFMLWNLILAWLPYLFSLWAMVSDRRYGRWAVFIPGLLWLLFFPNAPYMITDLVHLQPRAPMPMWYDLVLLTAFAWTGCLLAVASLSIMQSLVRRQLGRATSWLFVFATLGLTGLGIYLGRFLNWNSWDVFTRPFAVLSDVLIRLLNPLDYIGAYGVMLLFAGFLLVIYVAFLSFGNRRRI